MIGEYIYIYIYNKRSFAVLVPACFARTRFFGSTLAAFPVSSQWSMCFLEHVSPQRARPDVQLSLRYLQMADVNQVVLKCDECSNAAFGRFMWLYWLPRQGHYATFCTPCMQNYCPGPWHQRHVNTPRQTPRQERYGPASATRRTDDNAAPEETASARPSASARPY